jgi:C4-dicarboxylate-specific signal transduction histidine kinase
LNPNAGGPTLKVLIVEDRPEDTELMVRELRQASLTPDWRAVVTEPEYRQSLDWGPDVILSDFTLPQFNAFDALRIMQERQLDIPFIVVTGSISEETAVDCIKQGAVDYLLKDRMARLPAAVASALEEKRLRDEKRQTEDQLQERLAQLAHVSRLTTMGELVSELAHELNQPLYAIANYSEACLNVARSSSAQQTQELVPWLEQICEQSHRAGEIIKRIYGFVRKTSAHARPVNMNALVHDCAALLQVNLRHQGVALRLELTEELPQVTADPVQIQQVLVNLMNNAIDAMAHLPREERQLVVRSQRPGSNEIRVSVTDRGRGAADENLERLFEAFFTTKAEGMGMGLSISRSIIEAHDGRLWAERNPDRGLTFFFTLPIENTER